MYLKAWTKANDLGPNKKIKNIVIKAKAKNTAVVEAALIEDDDQILEDTLL